MTCLPKEKNGVKFASLESIINTKRELSSGDIDDKHEMDIKNIFLNLQK